MGQNRTFLAFGIALLLGSSSLLASCGFGVRSSTVTYGTPRTTQIDAIVGHHDGPKNPSHFEAMNLSGIIEVIEYPGGDASHAQVYMGPQLSGSHASQASVTLRFVDLTGDGRLDMIIQAQGSQIVFLNDGERFIPVPAGEEKQVMQRLHLLDGK
jgi:hypothetical protein